MRFKRILLKLSGEALMGTRQYGIDPERLAEYAADVKTVIDKGIEVAECLRRCWYSNASSVGY